MDWSYLRLAHILLGCFILDKLSFRSLYHVHLPIFWLWLKTACYKDLPCSGEHRNTFAHQCFKCVFRSHLCGLMFFWLCIYKIKSRSKNGSVDSRHLRYTHCVPKISRNHIGREHPQPQGEQSVFSATGDFKLFHKSNLKLTE